MRKPSALAEVEKIAVVIPARGGSKRVPGKNLRPLNKLPLLAHTINQANSSRAVESVYVSTDSDEIARVAKTHGAVVIPRPNMLSDDNASSESALIHAVEAIEEMTGQPIPAVVMLQCTSPIRRPGDIDAAIKQFLSDGADSLLSCCCNHQFMWRRDGNSATPVNYDYRSRPKSQEMEQFQENGSIYITRTKMLREQKNRLGGKISLFEMDFWSGFEIDSEDDFQLVEWVMAHTSTHADRQQRLPAHPQLVVFDFDGVMTDNTADVQANGEESVRIHRGDGYGVGLLKKAGFRMIVLSTEQNPVVLARCNKLGIDCIQGQDDKPAALKNLLDREGINAKDVIFVGNDLNDLGCYDIVGCGIAVADAHERILRAADIVLTRKGGDGAVRELVELILDAGAA